MRRCLCVRLRESINLETLFPDHPFDDVFCNRIRFGEDGLITGWEATPYDMEGKAHALELIARRESVPLERCAFVGDHRNDLSAARIAGFSIAFNASAQSPLFITTSI